LEQAELLTVGELAARLKCSPSFIYRRLKPSHHQYIPHTRLAPTDIRFDGRLVADLLAQQENSTVSKLDSAIRGGVKMTRRRDRQGSLRIKDGSWYVQWTEGHHRPSHCLGRVNELTKSEAQKLRREWMKKLNDHREVAGNSRTLASFWREHFYDKEKKELRHELKGKRPSTARDMRLAMNQIWMPRFGERLLDSLGTAEIQKHLDSLNLKRRTAAKYRTYLSSVFSSAIRLGHGLTYNPARFVKLPVEGPEQPYVLPTAEQVVAIQSGLKTPIHRMAWQLAVWLGNRSGELRGLRWESIVWEHNTILIRESVWEGQSTLPKTKKGYRKVVLTDEQMKVLREYKERNYPDAPPDAWVLPGKRGRPVDLGHMMSKYIKPLASKAGIPEIHWHALRHLNNSLMLNEGVDVKTRMDRLGHAHDRVNIIYSHAGDQAQLAASEAVWQKLKTAESELKQEPAAA
jgi:integrase